MTKLFLNQLYFINSLIKRNSKKVQDLSFISTQQPSELLYKGGSHNHSCPAPKEFQLQKKLSVGPPSREGLNYTKNPCFFPSTEGLWSEINVRSCLLKLLELFPYLSLGRRLVLTSRARHRARPRVQLLPKEQGALRPPDCSNPSSYPCSPSPQSLLQTELQGSPQPHTPLLTDTTSLLSAESALVYFYIIQNLTGLF